MTLRNRVVVGLLTVITVALTVCQASASSIVLNGSFENLSSPFVNDNCNYMVLSQGSTTITNWTVSASAPGGIALGKSPTCDSVTASQGQYFVDLSGIGTQSLNGTLEQQLTTIVGETYDVSIDLFTGNNGAVTLTIGSTVLALTAGTPFTVGTTSWTPYSGAYTATTTNPFLTVAKVPSEFEYVFVDNVSVSSQTAAPVPEPASLTLLGLGIMVTRLGIRHRRVRTTEDRINAKTR